MSESPQDIAKSMARDALLTSMANGILTLLKQNKWEWASDDLSKALTRFVQTPPKAPG